MKKLLAMFLSFGLVAGMMLPLVGCTTSTTKKTETKVEEKKEDKK